MTRFTYAVAQTATLIAFVAVFAAAILVLDHFIPWAATPVTAGLVVGLFVTFAVNAYAHAPHVARSCMTCAHRDVDLDEEPCASCDDACDAWVPEPAICGTRTPAPRPAP